MRIKREILAACVIFPTWTHSLISPHSSLPDPDDTNSSESQPYSPAPVFYVNQASCLADWQAPRLFKDELSATKQICTDRYNVYTDAHFWGERGISFVTTESVIESAVLDGLKRHYRRDVVLKVARDAFAERQIDGKGVGLVARRALRKGELIVWEPPTLVVHLDAHHHVPDQARLRMQRAAVESLSLVAKSETLGLMGHGGRDEIDDRLHVNSLAITLEKPIDHRALFTQTVRLNHACRPNCVCQFDRRSLTQKVYTIQDVEPGEELTISYIEPIATYEERRKKIEPWGFNCSCSACKLPEAGRRESDHSIDLIREYTRELQDWSNQSRGTPELAERLLHLYRKESLYGDIADGFQLASYAYSAVRDRYNALRMANSAIEYGLQTWREMGIRMNDTLQFMMDPEAHWTWGKRRGKV